MIDIKRMQEVYSEALSDFYRYEPKEIEYAKHLVMKNVKELGVSFPDEFATLNILNVGTGRESVALQQLGARHVYHFDISEIAVQALNQLKRKDPRYANISSCHRDICEPQKLPINDGIDLVYLSGVLHHLYDPATALKNIFDVMNHGARLFIRIYRSGILYYLIVDFIRRFIRYEQRQIFKEIFLKKYPEETPVTKNLYASAYDEFFVEILRLYDPGELDAYFLNHGFEVLYPQNCPPYDHENNARLDYNSVSLFYYHRPSFKMANTVTKTVKFPVHVDQLRDIAYHEEHIQKTVCLMNTFLRDLKMYPPRHLVELALDLYEIVFVPRQNSILQKRVELGAIDYTPPVPCLVSGQDLHHAIQERLRRSSL